MANRDRIASVFIETVGREHVLVGDAISAAYEHDEALTAIPVRPAAVVRPASTEQVAAVLRAANEARIPVTARGAGTGLSGACVPRADGIVVSFERMSRVLEIDQANFVAVVEPGVQLDSLDAELAPKGMVYPVFPGEYSSTLGGNVSTNAGGMRAVKYGVTRHNVLGLEAVLPSGDVLHVGGKFVKVSSGYDLTQLVIGSEGTLALVTKAYLRLYPRLAHATTVLAPFASLREVTDAVPRIIASGVSPVMLEYIDRQTMAGLIHRAGLELGVPEAIRAKALAYLVVVLESIHENRLQEDTFAVGEQLCELGAMDVYVLAAHAGDALIQAREKAFWLAKANGADDLLDVVVPRGSIAAFMERVGQIGRELGSSISGCGHAGDGNVHMAIFQKDARVRGHVMRRIFEAGLELGGAISGEHGLGTEKKKYFEALEDPAKLALMRRIKAAFDPAGILNPGTIFDPA